MLYINGKFLTQKITGVQRFAIEVTKELDNIVKPGEVALLTPPCIINKLELKNIQTIQLGNKSNNIWSQIIMPYYVNKNKGMILTLAGMYPILAPGFFVAHDITFIRHPESFSRLFRFVYKLNFTIAFKKCCKIFTVSEFSKKEIEKEFEIEDDNNIIVTNTAVNDYFWDVILNNFDVSKWNLEFGEYYLSVGSQNIHKNQKYIYECAKRYKDVKFVIVGDNKIKSFSSIEQRKLPNLIYTGYVSEDELLSLYKCAKGFIFPSLYEGFGLPPLEAIALGVRKVAVSDIEVFKEIYPRGVYHFDPEDIYSFDLDRFKEINITDDDRKFYREKYQFSSIAHIIWNVYLQEQKDE